MKTMVFDTETLGLVTEETNYDILIQLCYAVLEDNKIYDTFLRPKNYKNMSIKAMCVHDITPESLESEKIKEESKVFQDFKNLLESREEKILIAHNIKFDYEVLLLSGIKPNNCKLICTLKATQFLNDSQKLIYELNTLQYMKYFYRLDKNTDYYEKRFNINLDELSSHDARYDVIDLIGYYEFIKETFSATDESLIKLTEEPLILKYVPFGKNRGETFESLTFYQLKYYSSLDGNIAYTVNQIMERY